jgi:hypothetical protein
VASSFVQFKDDCEKKSFLAACIVLKTQWLEMSAT